ncbi:hypothetical protein KR222_011167, partial [Zaprionus bogoriensis]
STGALIRCYVCDSSDNPGCADLSDPNIKSENCTLDKMQSLDTWLFDLNKFSYFDNGANKEPLMNCQKVVARDPDTSKWVTARFCQLDTGDSDACAILRSKLHISSDNGGQGKRRRERDQHQPRRKGKDAEAEEKMEFFCGICDENDCNGADAVTLGTLKSYLTMGLLWIFV